MEIWDVNFSTLNTSTEKCNGWPSKITHTDNLTNGIYKADGMRDYPAFSINAVDIDWNGALMIFNDKSRIFNNTGDLLKYIQDLHNEVIDNELAISTALNELNYRIAQGGNSGGGSTVIPLYEHGEGIASLGNDLYINIPDLEIYKYEDHDGDQSLGVTTTWHLDIDRLDSIDILDVNKDLTIGGYNAVSKDNNKFVIGDSNINYLELRAHDGVYRVGDRGKKYELLDLSHFKLTLYYTVRESLSNSSGETTFSDTSNIAINVKSTTGNFLKLETILGIGDNATSFNMYFPLAEYMYDLGRLVGKIGLISGEDKYKLDNALTTNDLKLNYSNSQLSLMSGSTTFGNAISLSNIGGVKTFNVTTNSEIDNNIIYNGTSYLLSKFIHDNCTDGLNIIKITPNYSNPYYSELYIIVEYISKIESIYKEFIVTGHLLYNNNNTIAVVNDQDSLSTSWLITIDAKGYTSIEKNLGLDSRILPLVEVEQLNYIEGQNMSYGTSAQIKITSNVEGTIKNLYSDNDSSHSYDIIHLSKKLFLIEIKNNNTSSQTNRLSTLKIKFTPTDTENYKEVILDINIKGDNGQFLILNVKQSTVDYVLINADTKKLESLTSNPTYNYVGNNTTAIISLQKCNVSGSDITITPIEIDNYATELMRFIDYDRCEEFSKSEDTDIGTVSINNNTITFKSKAASVQSIYSCGFYKNKVIKIPYTEYSNYVEFSLYPKEFNSSEFVKDIYIYKYENGTLTSIDPDDSNSYLNDMIKYLHLSKGDTVLDYELHFTINENSATDIFNFRNTILFISTEGNINSLDNTTNGIMIHFIQETPSYTRIYYGLGLGYKNTDVTSNQGYSTNNQAYLNYLNTKEDWTEGLFSILNSKVINHFYDQLTLYSENFSEKLSSNRLDPKDYYYVAIPDIFFDVYKRPTYPKFNTKSYLWGDQSYTIYRKPVSDNMTEILTKK